MDTRNKIFTVVGTVAILATVGITGVVLFSQQDAAVANTTGSSQAVSSSSSATIDSTSTSTQTTTAQTPTTVTTGSYKDGTYTATVSYSVPHGETNTLKATIVIASDKISSVTTWDDYNDHESAQYISRFESYVSSDAKGQSIGSYSPSRIGGASLTTAAFDEALSTIANQAKA